MRKSFLAVIFLFIISLLMQSAVFAKNIRFVQVTDTHYMEGSEFRLNTLKAAIADINKLKDVSFVIFTGDNIEKPDPVALKTFVLEANKLNVPYYMVVGNHDCFRHGGLSKQKFNEIIKENNFFYRPNKPSYVFKYNGFVFIVVDGAKEIIPGGNGYFKKETLDWLDKQLVKYKDDPVVIFQHFPLVPPKKSKSLCTYEADKYIDMLSKHKNVIALIAGHYHTNYEVMKNGYYNITSPTLLAPPNCYKIIDIVVEDKFAPMIYTQLKPLSTEYPSY